ncbi:flavin containing amine oxidoreductase [Yasminevirus sp. GU-2018]|uniref:Flavin containing amine oxidoreductase n=1 Tax=Yasminevirus sp. GU-2018 TaxID=2420051 RepID=A0A5K0UAH0_9VIRU|nr:flavin containing amine oxidoreductase [Yasminevirus sp. GU-2018]
MTTYDYCIVGAGPSGFTASWYLSRLGYKVLLVDREDVIGGVHRVVRATTNNGVENSFTEHSPRIYSGGYLAFIHMLKEMHIDFFKIFAGYSYNIFTIMLTVVVNFSILDIVKILIGFIKYIFVDPEGSVDSFLKSNHFSDKGSDVIDRFCRLLDGGGADRMLSTEMFHSFDFIPFYRFYQPIAPNDELLMRLIEDRLTKNGVTILKGHELIDMNTSLSKVTSAKMRDVNSGETTDIFATRYVLATPPKNVLKVVKNSSDQKIQSAFGDLEDFEKYVINSSYNEYPSMVFYWDKQKNVKTRWGFPSGEWGVINIKVSDYYSDSTIKKNSNRQIMSLTLAKADFPNKDGLTYYQFLSKYGESVTAKEILRQLRSQSAVPDYDDFTFNRVENDSGFIRTTKRWRDYHTNLKNLYWIGCHNGNSKLELTTLESAVQNGITFVDSHLKLNGKLLNFPKLNKISDLFYPLVYVFNYITSMLGLLL